MNKLFASAWALLLLIPLAGCNKQPAEQTADQSASPAAQTQLPDAAPTTQEQPAAPAEPTGEAPAPAATPSESISETDEPADAIEQNSAVQPSIRVGAAPAGPPTSAQFREGVNYQKIVPAQPTSVAPGKVEVVEVFWYGCGHCFTLDPAIESWRNKRKAANVEFVRVPAMWNESTRLHARMFYAAELLTKLDALHSGIFREMHVNGNQLNSVDKIADFFQKHGVDPDEFKKAFSSFAVESKLQRADFLNRRYRVDSVPLFIVNGKYKTGQGEAGGEPALFQLIDELAASERGG